MSMSIQQASDFDPNTVHFSKLRKNKNGGKTIYINHGDNKKLYIQCPKMRAPYGLSCYEDDSTKKCTYSLDLSFDEDNAEASAFKAKLQALDERIIDHVTANSEELLGKKFAKEVFAEALYKPIVRKSSKPEYPDTFKIKILTNNDGGFIPECYNMQRQAVSLNTIGKGQKLYAIIDCVQLWFIDGKCGVTIRLTQCLLEEQQKLPSFAFQGIELPPAASDVQAEYEEEEEEFDDGAIEEDAEC